jgi:hypothetical protein
MDETLRMLGREHEADLEREAQRRRLAALAEGAPKTQRTLRPSRGRRRLGHRRLIRLTGSKEA